MLNYTFDNKNKFKIKIFLSIINNLIKDPNLNSRYLSILAQVATKDNDIYDLAELFIVDRNNNKSISACKFNLKVNCIDFFENNDLEIIHLTITYNQVDRKNYINYIKEFYKNKNALTIK